MEAELLYQHGLPPQATYLFKHALIQEAAYQSLLWSTRQQYHQRIAQVLETQFPDICETQPELLAHHYTEASLVTQAIPYWQRAGQRAMERSANAEGISHFTQALALLATLPESTAARHYLEQGMALYDPRQHRALALRYGADSGIVCSLYAGWVLWAFGYPEQALHIIHDALTQARALAHIFTLAFALNHTALIQMFRCEGQQAQERADASIAFATEQRIAQWLAQGTVLRGWALSAQGRAAVGCQQICQGMAAWRATGRS